MLQKRLYLNPGKGRVLGGASQLFSLGDPFSTAAVPFLAQPWPIFSYPKPKFKSPLCP